MDNIERRLDDAEEEAVRQEDRIERLERTVLSLDRALTRMRNNEERCAFQCLKRRAVPDYGGPHGAYITICVSRCELAANHAGPCAFACDPSCPSHDCMGCVDERFRPTADGEQPPAHFAQDAAALGLDRFRVWNDAALRGSTSSNTEP